MEKKNTILLTAIAVGTLLVVVVGATYAYFAVSSSDSENTTVDANVEGVGSVALSGGAEITKTISAADMAKSKAPSTYDLGVANIATATLTDTVGTATYYCEFTLTVTNGSNMTTNGSTDGGIDVTVANNVSITTISGSDFTRGANLAPTAINAGTYKVEFQMGVGDTSVPSGTNLIELTGAIKNSETDDTQDERLAGKNINLEYAVAGFSCDTTKHTLSSKVISLVGKWTGV